MKYEPGRQYSRDDEFKKRARTHQSEYRANILKVDYENYGNRLKDEEAQKDLIYYDGLNCRAVLRKRFPRYSKKRDADMLRSEHMPFNLLAPLETDTEAPKGIILDSFGIECAKIEDIKYEHAPPPKDKYLNDMTAFDVYISCKSPSGTLGGIGIEVKYTEREYKIGKSEKDRVNDPDSTYWRTTRASGAFVDPGNCISRASRSESPKFLVSTKPPAITIVPKSFVSTS